MSASYVIPAWGSGSVGIYRRWYKEVVLFFDGIRKHRFHPQQASARNDMLSNACLILLDWVCLDK